MSRCRICAGWCPLRSPPGRVPRYPETQVADVVQIPCEASLCLRALCRACPARSREEPDPSPRACHHIAATAQGKGRRPALAEFPCKKPDLNRPGCGSPGRTGIATRQNILRKTAPASLDGPTETLLHAHTSRCAPGAAAQRAAPRAKPDGHGSVAEWFKALVLKTSVRGTVPWVRIPPLPPLALTKPFSRSGYGWIFPLFSGVMRAALSTSGAKL